MNQLVIGGLVALIIGLLGTRAFIGLAMKKGLRQFVRQDGPTTHLTKRGTPQMGGLVIIAAALLGYGVAHLVTWTAPTASGLLVIFLLVGVGFIGFLDDWAKIRRENSAGLSGRQKVIGQVAVASIFAVLAVNFPRDGITPASFHISFVRDTGIDLAFAGLGLGIVLFTLWSIFMVAGTSNGVNLTDGLDGLAPGSSGIVFFAYGLISMWQASKACAASLVPQCYVVRDPLDLALLALCIAAACFGFLWWNAAPARIFMGDTGSLALGAALAGIAILTRTELLLIILGGLFVFETVTVMMQVGYFKLTKRLNNGVGKRLFKFTPIHHHFELLGWEQVTVTVRFWIICGICAAAGLAIFFAEWSLV